LDFQAALKVAEELRPPMRAWVTCASFKTPAEAAEKFYEASRALNYHSTEAVPGFNQCIFIQKSQKWQYASPRLKSQNFRISGRRPTFCWRKALLANRKNAEARVALESRSTRSTETGRESSLLASFKAYGG